MAAQDGPFDAAPCASCGCLGEPYQREALAEAADAIGPLRGIIYGLIAGTVFWAIILFPFWRRLLPNG